MVLICISVLYPCLYVLACSFSNNNSVVRGEVSIYPVRPTLDAYRYLFKYRLIGSGYQNTLFLVIVGTAINMLLTMTTAYGLAKKTLVGRKPLMFMITFTMMFNGGLIPNYILVSDLKLMDTLWSLILPSAISAYNLIIMKNFFETLPEELNEAARIDGLSEIGILFRIVVPLSMASIATIGLFYAVGHWNAYFSAALYLNSRRNWPLQLVLRNLLANANMSELPQDLSSTVPYESLKMAVVVVTIGPIIVLYPFIQKYFVKGVMIGSLKG